MHWPLCETLQVFVLRVLIREGTLLVVLYVYDAILVSTQDFKLGLWCIWWQTLDQLYPVRWELCQENSKIDMDMANRSRAPSQIAAVITNVVLDI